MKGRRSGRGWLTYFNFHPQRAFVEVADDIVEVCLCVEQFTCLWRVFYFSILINFWIV